MRDLYTESIVKNTPSTGLIITKYLSLVLVFFSFISTPVCGIYAWIAVALFVILYFWALQKTDSEYEYIHTNQTFDIDLVIRKKKRKQLTTIDLGKVIVLAPIGHAELECYSKIPVIDYSGKQGNRYAMVVGVAGTQKALLLSLDGEMCQSLKKAIPSKVHLAQ